MLIQVPVRWSHVISFVTGALVSWAVFTILWAPNCGVHTNKSTADKPVVMDCSGRPVELASPLDFSTQSSKIVLPAESGQGGQVSVK